MTSKRAAILLATVITASALAACGRSTTSGEAAAPSGSFNIEDGQVVITAKGAPDAQSSADGRLTIDGRDIAVTEGQRAQLQSYYDAVLGVLQQAAPAGAAGARIGAATENGGAGGPASGDMSAMKAKVEAQASEVRRLAARICENLADARAAQDALAAQVPAFKPYAVVSVREANDCSQDLHKGPRS